MKKKYLRILSGLLCLIWIFLSSFALVLPHEHHFSDPDCAICHFLEEHGEADLYSSVKPVEVLFAILVLAAYAFVPALRAATPVGKKVKLSD